MKKSTSKTQKKRNQAGYLKQINQDAAAIDIGSREHYVAVPEDRDKNPVRSFKCFTPDLHKMAKWLKSCSVKTVAMESTGSYWIPVYYVLNQYGLEIKLVDARQAKNVPGRKTDVADCQWLQQLHTFGLLSSAFIPDEEISILRTYWRHRACLVESASKQINLMQKALEHMNIQLHKVLSDITGLTGMRIIRSIVKGEHDPLTLAKMKHPQVKSSEETIVKALTGNYREEQLFALSQSLDLYDFYQEKIEECDKKVEGYMKKFPKKGNFSPTGSLNKKRRKNQPYFDLRSALYEMTGVDLTKIDGIDTMIAQTIISECGFDMSKFLNEKRFASWLALCPHPSISGGKIVKKSTKKTANRAATALRLAAQSLHRSKSALGAYYRRMRSRLGAPKAITATAHKLARIIYRMLKFGDSYVDKGQHYYEEQYRQRAVKNLKRRAKQLGYSLSVAESGELVS